MNLWERKNCICFRWNNSSLATQSYFMFSLHFARLYVDQLTSTYFQTFMLWLLAYRTLIVPMRSFNERFIGGITVLLVFASLLWSICVQLPKSSQMIFIDYWFLWYTSNILFIIILHGVITNLKCSYKKKKLVNRIIFFILPIFMMIFNVAYFRQSVQ